VCLNVGLEHYHQQYRHGFALQVAPYLSWSIPIVIITFDYATS